MSKEFNPDTKSPEEMDIEFKANGRIFLIENEVTDLNINIKNIEEIDFEHAQYSDQFKILRIY